MDADQLLNSLGVAMGLPGLAFDGNGCARLMFDGKLAVNLEHDADAGTIQAFSAIAPLPARGREALYSMLLQGNLFGGETQGATLAIDIAQQEVVLSRAIDVAATGAPAFAALIEAFVNATEHWQQRVANSGGAAAPVPIVTRIENFLRG
jgi:hypothetical protein